MMLFLAGLMNFPNSKVRLKRGKVHYFLNRTMRALHWIRINNIQTSLWGNFFLRSLIGHGTASNARSPVASTMCIRMRRERQVFIVQLRARVKQWIAQLWVGGQNKEWSIADCARGIHALRNCPGTSCGLKHFYHRGLRCCQRICLRECAWH